MRDIDPTTLFLMFGVAFLVAGLVGFLIAGVMRALSDGRIGDIEIAIWVLIAGGIGFIIAAFLYPMWAQRSHQWAR